MLKRTLLAGLTGLMAASSQADTLQEVYMQALQNDHQIKADEAAFLAGKEATNIGRANLLPNISARAGFTKTEQDSVGALYTGGPSATTNIERESEAYTATLTQPLFNMAAWYGYQQGKAQGDVAEHTFAAAQQSLIVRVVQAYLNVLQAIDSLNTSKAEQKAFAHQLEQTRQRFEVGLAAITDVHEAQAAHDSATARALQAQGNVGIQFEALEVLTGKPSDAISPLANNFPVVNPAPAARAEWVEFALSNNYKLKVAKAQASAAQQGAKAAKAGHYPTISGQISYTHYNDANTDIYAQGSSFSSDSRTIDGTTYAVNLDVPIYSGGGTSAKRRQAYQGWMQAQELLNKAQRDTIQAARSAHLQVMTDVAQVKAQKQALTSNQSAQEATQAGYEVGTRNIVDVLQAQQRLYNAQRNYDNSRYSYILNNLRLKEAAGTLSPEDIKSLDQWVSQTKPITRAEIEES
ncbi:MAG: TolC family outer membrane protein [Cellvibrionaceae bacterium]|nr:TolC family outer membrane protein [Cellvibrionaceae bacterium]MCV6624603.1 TolC family outer membrane protein [Cellvibrionaceae bacterium]